MSPTRLEACVTVGIYKKQMSDKCRTSVNEEYDKNIAITNQSHNELRGRFFPKIRYRDGVRISVLAKRTMSAVGCKLNEEGFRYHLAYSMVLFSGLDDH